MIWSLVVSLAGLVLGLAIASFLGLPMAATAYGTAVVVHILIFTVFSSAMKVFDPDSIPQIAAMSSFVSSTIGGNVVTGLFSSLCSWIMVKILC